MNFNCISYSLPKNKMLSHENIFSKASNSKIRDPFQSFCLPTHDYSFQLKSTLFLFVAFCLRFNKGTKNMTMELDPYVLVSVKIGFDFFAAVIQCNVYGSVFQINAVQIFYLWLYCRFFFKMVVQFRIFWNAISFLCWHYIG